MLGLGETEDEVLTLMRDAREMDCNILTIGQYLRPTKQHLPVAEFVHPDRFKALEEAAYAMGSAPSSPAPRPEFVPRGTDGAAVPGGGVGGIRRLGDSANGQSFRR